jgi:hypothetical protein
MQHSADQAECYLFHTPGFRGDTFMSIFNQEAQYKTVLTWGATKTPREVKFFLLPSGTTVVAKWTIIRDQKVKHSFTYDLLTVWQFRHEGKIFTIEPANEASQAPILKVASQEFLYLGDSFFPKSQKLFPKRTGWTTSLESLPIEIGSMQGNTFSWENATLFGSELYAEYTIRYRMTFDLNKLRILFDQLFHSRASCHTE